MMNILFDGIDDDDNSHIRSIILGVVSLFCASPDLISNPSLNEKQLSYMIDFISSRKGRLMAAEVNSLEQYGALLKMELDCEIPPGTSPNRLVPDLTVRYI